MMPVTPEARRFLANRMDERRTRLRLRWQDVAARGQVSLKALYDARTGAGGISARTEWGIETGLSWPPGTVRAILGGRESAPGTTEPEPPARPELAQVIPLAVATAIDTLVSSLKPIIEAEIDRAGPYATGAEIFASEHEAAIWDLTWPKFRRISMIAFLRATRVQDEAGNPGAGNLMPGAAGFFLRQGRRLPPGATFATCASTFAHKLVRGACPTRSP